MVKEQRIIYLTINASEVPQVKMPDLVDKDLHQATLILESLGLKLGEVTEIKGAAEDNVRQQLFRGAPIQPNTQISKGSVIDLVTEDGSLDYIVPDESEIPNLIDYTLEEAKELIEAKGLLVGNITVIGKVADSASAIITAQSPMYQPDLLLRRGEKIDLTIKNQ
jgi:beta-lactam-binding protein with PASTA domain